MYRFVKRFVVPALLATAEIVLAIKVCFWVRDAAGNLGWGVAAAIVLLGLAYCLDWVVLLLIQPRAAKRGVHEWALQNRERRDRR